MKTLKKIFVGAVLLLLCGPIFAERIAVSSFNVSGYEDAKQIERIIIDIFVSQLSVSPELQILDRQNIEKILTEQELALSGLVDSNTIIETGSILGATAIVTGNYIVFGEESFFSARCIDNTTGEVLSAVSGPVKKSLIAEVSGYAASMTMMLGGSEGKGGSSALWYTQAAAENREKPILIYAMSNVDDSVDEYGQWYLGPSQIKPVTEALRLEGYSVEVHDRRTLPNLEGINFADYSQIWLLEGDSNSKVDPSGIEVLNLYNYYLNGGNVWLCGENIPDPIENNWVEDINAFAKPFDLAITKTVIPIDIVQRPQTNSHPLLRDVRTLVFDTEVGLIEGDNLYARILLAIEPSARVMGPKWNFDRMLQYADPKRYNLVAKGKRPEWTIGWIMGENFQYIGPEVGENACGICFIDGRDRDQGRFVLDAGWLLGWAFTESDVESYKNADNLQFVLNAADWFKRP